MRSNRVLLTVGVLAMIALARVCAADPLSAGPPASGSQLGQAIPQSQLSQIRGAGIAVPMPVASAEMIRLWDELRGRRPPPQNDSNYSMGTLTVTTGSSGQR